MLLQIPDGYCQKNCSEGRLFNFLGLYVLISFAICEETYMLSLLY